MAKVKKKNPVGLFLLYLVLAAIGVLALFPIVYAVFGSFKPNQEFVAGGSRLLPKVWRFANYSDAWKLANFATYTWNSIYMSVVSVAGVLFMSSMAGYVFARADFPGKRIILTCFLATMFISTGSITLYPTLQIAKFLHVNKTLWGVIIVYVFGVNVANIYLVMGYIKGIPKEIDEAAIIDGCSFFSIFIRLILPLSKPIIATLGLLTFKGTWNDYLLPLVFTMTSEKLRPLTVGVIALRDTNDGAAAWNIMLAGTAISLIPIVIIYIFTNRYFISGITAGAVKA